MGGTEAPIERGGFEGQAPPVAAAARLAAADRREGAPARLPAEALRALATLHPLIGYRDIAIEWAGIAAAIWTCLSFPHPLVYVVAVMFIGARQHALLILLHDGAHRLLSRSGRVNDLVAELFLAWPFVILHMRNYRLTHLLHHRFVNTHQDPDWTWKQAARWPWRRAGDGSGEDSLWRFPVGRGRMIALLAMNLFFYGFWTALRRNSNSAKRERSPGERPFLAGWLVYQAVLFGTLSYNGWLAFYLLFWIVPMVTWLQLCMLIRGIAEHFAIDPDRRAFGETRTTISSMIDRLFIVPRNIGYHVEHHLHPFIPYHALPECHRQYRRLKAFRDKAHVTQGYWGVLKECVERS